MKSKDALSSLNPAQQKAVIHNHGPILVLAGAGSGKTRVLTHRIAYLIHHGVDPRHILAVTFTNKAAGEMKERVNRLLDRSNVDGILWIGTFHGICVKILKREIARLDGYNERFTIYDEYDQQSLVKECLKSLNLDDKKYNPAGIVGRIGRAKDNLIDVRQYKELASGYFEKQVSKIYELYQARLRQSNAVDFGDLIMLTVGIFRQFSMGLKDYLAVLLAEKTAGSLERADNVRELVSAAVQFEKANPGGAGLHSFLEEISLVSNVDIWKNSSGAVTLMTLHSAKGLEFPVCFMAGMEEGIFPHFGRDGETIPELEEERRLCYVGMTRTKERLFLTSARRRMIYGRWGDAERSRFVGEIEGEYLEEE